MIITTIIRDNAIVVAKKDINDDVWYIPHYVHSMENQHIGMKQTLDKDPTELCYTERNVFRKDVNTNINWTFELGNSGDSTQPQIKLIQNYITTLHLINFKLVFLFVK